MINSGETGARTGQQIIWGTISVKNWGFLLLSREKFLTWQSHTLVNCIYSYLLSSHNSPFAFQALPYSTVKDCFTFHSNYYFCSQQILYYCSLGWNQLFYHLFSEPHLVTSFCGCFNSTLLCP